MEENKWMDYKEYKFRQYFSENNEEWSKLKKWIEETPLFRVIKQHAGTGLIIESVPYEFRLKLNGISKVEKAEDLPIELIQNFYENSPFYTDNSFTQKQIENNE